jgi:hypothetical protein
MIAAAFVVVPRTATAQAKTVSSKMKVETAIVEAIDPAARTVTLKKLDGTVVTIAAPPDIKRFAEVKVGDTVTARFYENVVVRVKSPGEPEVDTAAKGTTGSEQILPGGTKARQWTITATISAVDMDTPSITFTGPNARARHVTDDGRGRSCGIPLGSREDGYDHGLGSYAWCLRRQPRDALVVAYSARREDSVLTRHLKHRCDLTKERHP